MKKILFGLIATVLFTSLLFGQNNIDIGKLHNEVLSVYYQQHGNEDIVDLVKLNNDLFQINAKMYPEEFKDITPEDIEKFTLDLFGTSDAKNFNYRNRINYLLDLSVTQGHISIDLCVIYKTILAETLSKDAAFKKMDDFLMNSNVSTKDKQSIALLKSMYIASDQFWTSMQGSVGNSVINRCNPRTQVRFADGYGTLMGAVIGSSFPGFGSYIGGFLGGQGMSALIEHLQDQQGGGCI